MTPDQPADHDKAEILAWLVAQRRWLAPNVVALRDREGRVVVESHGRIMRSTIWRPT